MNGKEKNVNEKNAFLFIRWGVTLSAFVLIIYLLRDQGWDQIWGAVLQIGRGRFIFAFILMIVSRLMMVGRWYILLHSSDEKITLLDALNLTFAGLFANNFLPSTIGGDVVRFAGAVQVGYGGVITAASLIVDRLVGMFGMALALPIGLYQVVLNSAKPGIATIPNWWVVAGVLPAGLQKYWAKVYTKVLSLMKRLWQAIALWIHRPRALLGSLVFTGVHMTCFFGILWVLLDGMNDTVPFWMIGGLWSLVYFVTLIPISINGLGVQEVAITFAFSTLGSASEPNTLTLALLFRTMVMLVSLPGALFIPRIMPEIKKQK